MRKFSLEGDLDNPLDEAFFKVSNALRNKNRKTLRANLIAIGNTALSLANDLPLCTKCIDFCSCETNE